MRASDKNTVKPKAEAATAEARIPGGGLQRAGSPRSSATPWALLAECTPGSLTLNASDISADDPR